MMLLELKYEGRSISGECPLNAPLLAYMQGVGVELSPGVLLYDGSRVVDPQLELAHRWAGKALRGHFPAEAKREYPALRADELCPKISAQ